MDWILENVAVGRWQDALNQNLLKSEGVGAILNVRSDENDFRKKEANEREEEKCSAENREYCLIPLIDLTTATDDEFVSGIAFIERNVKLGRKVLVHCAGGLGRSPSFVAVYLLFKRLVPDADSAIELIQDKRPGCFEDPDDIHIPRIREFEEKLLGLRAQIRERIQSGECI